MSTSKQRIPITRFSSLVARFRVFCLDHGVEIEERSGSIQLRRVLFDEIQLLTLHRARNWASSILLSLLGLLSGTLGMAFGKGGETNISRILYLIALVLLLAAIGLFMRPKHIVTITSRRARLAMSFGLNGEKARQWLTRLQQEVSRAQQAAAAEVASQNAAIEEASRRHFGALPMPPVETSPSPMSPQGAVEAASPPAPSVPQPPPPPPPRD